MHGLRICNSHEPCISDKLSIKKKRKENFLDGFSLSFVYPDSSFGWSTVIGQ